MVAKSKKSKVRLPKSMDTKYLGTAPRPLKYPTSNVEKIHLANWYNYFYNTTEMRQWFVDWCKDILTKKQIAVLKDNMELIPRIFGLKAHLAKQGTEFTIKELQDMKNFAIKIATENKPKEVIVDTDVENKPKLSVYQLMLQKAGEITAFIDNIIDNFYIDNDSSLEEPIYTVLSKKGVKGKVANVIADKYKAELDDLPDDANTEHRQFLEELIAACEKINTVQKIARRANTKKTVTSTKKKTDTSKVKYLKYLDEFNIASEDPEKLIGAKAVWLYNNRYKRIVLLKATNLDGFGIKVSTLTNVDMDSASSKRIRKPVVTFAEIMQSTPAKTIKTKKNHILESLSTKYIPVKTVRLTDDVVILKIFK